MGKGDVYAGGLDIPFFASANFEKSADGRTSQEQANIIARNALRLLMMGWQNGWEDLLSLQVIKAVFLRRDPELMRGMRLAFQEGFQHVCTQLQDANVSPESNPLQFKQAQLFLSNCLSLLPYGDINPYESISIPQWINNSWQLVDYKVVPIELTPTKGFKALFIRDEDRVFAYGLEPINRSDAEPHLIFMGTTYPAGQGFFSQIKTDMEAFETAGKKLYRSGYKKITEWLDKQQQKAHVCGISLGGALAGLLAIHLGDKLSRVVVLNPAGLYLPWRKSRFDRWDQITDKPSVCVQKNKGDPVSPFGVWKEDWDIVEVTPPEDREGPNALAAHAMNYAGLAETEFLGVDTKADNAARSKRNFILYTVLRSLFYYTVAVPFYYIVLPILRYILSHKMQLTLTVAFALLFSSQPAFALALIIPALTAQTLLMLNIVVSSVMTAFLVDKSLAFLLDKVSGKKDSDFSQFFSWLNHQSLVTKLFFTLGLAATVWEAAAPVIMPTLIPLIAASTALYILAAVPLAIYLVHRLGSAIQIIFGWNEVQAPLCHDPKLPRNDLMNMYSETQKIEAEFTYEQLNSYYHAKRCILKNKPFLPEMDKGHVEFREDDSSLSKREVLERGLSHPQAVITVKATKAKIYDIKETVAIMGKIGLHSLEEGRVKESLEPQHQAYQRGKV
ncbi:TPA: hypothetical protein ACPSKE_000108 [Legionella feeleii]